MSSSTNQRLTPKIIPAKTGEALNFCKKHIPHAFLGTNPAQPHVAVIDGDRIVGVASFRSQQHGEKNVGRILIFVKPEFRRQGLGSQLMKAMLELAHSHKVESILMGSPVTRDSTAGLFLQTFGMEEADLNTSYRLETAPQKQHAVRMMQKLKQRNRIPEGFSIVTIADANPQRIARFVEKYLGTFAEAIIRQIKSGKQKIYPKLSPVIRSASEPVGVILVKAGRHGVTVDTRVVHPRFRKGWVNAALLSSMLINACRAGVKELYFEAHRSKHGETMHMAESIGATVIEEQVFYGRSL